MHDCLDIFVLQELEKFKFVLDFKIKDLKQQIEPREVELQESRDQICKMEIELGRLDKLVLCYFIYDSSSQQQPYWNHIYPNLVKEMFSKLLILVCNH